jgi:hypothetical protein
MEIVDLDKEIDAAATHHKDFPDFITSSNCTHYMYARAINARDGACEDELPYKFELERDIDLMIHTINRMIGDFPFKRPEYDDITGNGKFLSELLEFYRCIRNLNGFETKFQTDELNYKIGDKVWYVMGDLAILCTVRSIDYCGLYYWLDEPIGHSEDAVTDDKNLAIEWMTEWMEEHETARKEICEEKGTEYIPKEDRTLDEFRRSASEICDKNHENPWVPSEEELSKWHPEVQEKWKNDKYEGLKFTEKERITEWFTWNDVLEGKV